VIKVEINPARIERIVLESPSAIERDFDAAAYAIIRPYLDRIDRRLRQVAEGALKERTDPRLRKAAEGAVVQQGVPAK